MKFPDTIPSINLTPVAEERDIHSIGHDPATETLAIRFRDRKTGAPSSLYHYAHVDGVLFAKFAEAESVTDFFREHIRPATVSYPYRKVEQAPAAQL